MPGPGTAFLGGPVMTGSLVNQSDFGLCILTQNVTLTHNTTNAVSATMTIPQGSRIIDIITDTPTVWNSATSDTLSVGILAAGTDYASGVDVKTTGLRIRPTFTGAQLTAMSNVGSSTTVVATVTPVGSATAGSTIVTLVYAQTVQLNVGTD
jgi:hypothetical protein